MKKGFVVLKHLKIYYKGFTIYFQKYFNLVILAKQLLSKVLELLLNPKLL